MRKNIFVFILSAFLFFNLSSLTSAAWVSDTLGDTAGGPLLTSYDIGQTNMELWQPTPGKYYLKVSVDMAAGGKTPAVVAIELDVDSDTASGGTGSMASIPFPNCTLPSMSKTEPGFDIVLMVTNREQASNSASAISATCGSCPNGGETYDTCTSPLDNCGIARERGAWWGTVNVSSGGAGVAYFESGRIDLPLPTAVETVDGDLCYVFDYSRIVQSAYDYIGTALGNFNLSKAQDPNNYLKYQVSVWHSSTYGIDGEDFLKTTPPLCKHIIDVCPDVGKAAAEVPTDGPCPADFSDGFGSWNPDGKVGSFELIGLKNSYGYGDPGNPGCLLTCE